MDQVVAVSNALADRASRIVGFPRDLIHVIPNSVDTDAFQPSEVPKWELRQRLDLPSGGVLVGMVARFVPFKDHAGAIRAVAELRTTGVEAHLAFAGSGQLRDELGQLAHELGVTDRVHFLGELAQVERLLHALDVFVSNSSHNEGMSLSVLEAMACGIPVVSTRVAAAPEVLDEGNAGILIPPRDAKALADAIRTLAEEPDTSTLLGRMGRKRAKDHYSVTVMVKAYQRLYERLAGFSKTPREEAVCH